MFLIALFDKNGRRSGYLRKTLKVIKGEELVPRVRIAYQLKDALSFTDSAAATAHMATLPIVSYRVVERMDANKPERYREAA